MLSQRNTPNATTVLSTAASLAASVMLIQNVASVFIPNSVRKFLFSGLCNLSHHFSSQMTIVIDEFQVNIRNQIFEAAHIYLGNKVTRSVRRVRVSKAEEEKRLAIAVDKGEQIVDVFRNVQLRWRLVCRYFEKANNTTEETRSYEVTFHKKHKETVLNGYFPYLLEQFEATKEENKVIKLHSVDYRSWLSCENTFDHPMTFKNLALNPELKKAVLDDLNTFMNAKEFYRRIGRAWKRGYLLYGPPGSGKSSLIAAMANYLNYDIYNLDLTGFENSDLRSMWCGISRRSMIVFEDIDCAIKLQNRESEHELENDNQNHVTLSGLLNVIDGVWSCLGSERIIVLTTNYKESLDSALLRPGRMDMHIHLSYCTFSVFKQLAVNYLGIFHHTLFEEIEELIQEVEVTPAEVAGEIMKSNDAQVSLQGLVDFLYKRKFEPDEPKTSQDIEFQEQKEERRGRPLMMRGVRRGRGMRGRGFRR